MLPARTFHVLQARIAAAEFSTNEKSRACDAPSDANPKVLADLFAFI
jgi:hypothetical protein